MTAKKKKMGTGFAAPMFGTVYPKDVVIKRNSDGTATLVEPKKTTKKGKKK